jgi:hypothetical protein
MSDFPQRPQLSAATTIGNLLLPSYLSLPKTRLVFGFVAADWLFLAGGIVLAAVVAAVLVL